MPLNLHSSLSTIKKPFAEAKPAKMVSIYIFFFACLYALVYALKGRNKRKRVQKAHSAEFESHPARVLSSHDQTPGRPRRTVMVVGGNTYLGKCIVAMLASKKFHVVVFDSEIPDDADRKDSVSYVKGSLLNVSHIIAALFLTKNNVVADTADDVPKKPVDSVIHVGHIAPCVGLPDVALWELNVTGTKNLIEQCVQFDVKTFVHSTSAYAALVKSDVCVRGLTEAVAAQRRINLGKDYQSLNLWTDSLLTAEDIVTMATRASSRNPGGTASCTLRPGVLFGSGDTMWAELCLNSHRNVYFGSGDAYLEFTPIENAALAHVLAEDSLTDREQQQKLKKKGCLSQETYFVGNGEHYSYGWFMGLKSTDDASVVAGAADSGAAVANNKKKDDGDEPTASPTAPATASSTGAKEADAVSHWGNARPEAFSLRLAYTLCALNEWWDSITEHSFLPRWWTSSYVHMTQVTFTCNTDKARDDFQFRPVISVDDCVQRLAKYHGVSSKQHQM